MGLPHGSAPELRLLSGIAARVPRRRRRDDVGAERVAVAAPGAAPDAAPDTPLVPPRRDGRADRRADRHAALLLGPRQDRGMLLRGPDWRENLYRTRRPGAVRGPRPLRRLHVSGLRVLPVVPLQRQEGRLRAAPNRKSRERQGRGRPRRLHVPALRCDAGVARSGRVLALPVHRRRRLPPLCRHVHTRAVGLDEPQAGRTQM